MTSQAKGLREQLKDPPTEFPSKTLSIETLRSYLTGIMKDAKLEFSGWTHYTWKEGDNSYSMWCTKGLCTGDGGMELYNQQFKNKVKDEYDNT